MMKIGEFARENKVTVRTLHHYESLELLFPAEIDPTTGYRFYEPDQAKRLKVIHILKELGFSLSEIAGLLSEDIDREELTALLNRKYLQARIDRENALNRSLGIEGLLDAVKQLPDGEKVNLLEVSDMSIMTIENRLPREEFFAERFDAVLRAAREEKKNITLMVLDIDNFLRVNNDFGHRVGDAVMDAVRRCIIACSPGGSGILWGNVSVMEHKGGDEYLNWVETDPAAGVEIARNIRREVEAIDFSYLGMDRPVTVSLGVVNLADYPVDMEEFIRLGDEALYKAKIKGRNSVAVAEPDSK